MKNILKLYLVQCKQYAECVSTSTAQKVHWARSDFSLNNKLRDGTAETVSRDQIPRASGDRGTNFHFPCSADHEQDWQPYPVDPSFTLAIIIGDD